MAPSWKQVRFNHPCFLTPFSPPLTLSLKKEIVLTVALDRLHDSVLKVNTLPVETIETRRHHLVKGKQWNHEKKGRPFTVSLLHAQIYTHTVCRVKKKKRKKVKM